MRSFSILALSCIASAAFMVLSTLLACLSYFGAVKGKYPEFDISVYPEGNKTKTKIQRFKN